MINRVSDNDYYDYKKLNMPTAADTNSSGEKFSLDYQRADDKKEDDEKKEKISKEGMDKNLAGNRPRTVVQSGVKLELSGDGQEKAETGGGSAFSDLIQTVRSWLTMMVQSFKGLLNRIWNDPVPEDTVLSADEAPVEETDRLSEEYLEMNSSGQENAMKAETVEAVQSGSEERSALESAADAGRTGNPTDSADSMERIGQLLSGRGARDQEIQKYLRSGNLEQVITLLTENGHRTMAKNSSLLTYYDRTGRLTSLSASDQERILHGDRNVKKL